MPLKSNFLYCPEIALHILRGHGIKKSQKKKVETLQKVPNSNFPPPVVVPTRSKPNRRSSI